jgi:hypothetical protein
MMNLNFSLILVCLIFFSCASVERRKYFKANETITSYLADEFDISVDNRALITYAAGPFIPFIPVYLFEDMRRDIKKDEDLIIKFTPTKYLGPSRDHFAEIKINAPHIELPNGKVLHPKEKVVTYHEVKFIYPIKALVAKEFTIVYSTIIYKGETMKIPRTGFKFVNNLRYRCCDNFAP